MFSRIKAHREDFGTVLLGIGVLWLMGVAGADDFNTAQIVVASFLALVVKTAFGLLAMGAGALMIGEVYEEYDAD